MNTRQMTDLDLVYWWEHSKHCHREEVLRRAEFVPRYVRHILSLGLEYYYRVLRYKNIKPEQIRHLTDNELLLLDVDEANFDAWKKEFEARDRLGKTNVRNSYLTRKEFNHDNLSIHATTPL